MPEQYSSSVTFKLDTLNGQCQGIYYHSPQRNNQLDYPLLNKENQNMTNYVEFKHFTETDYNTRCSYIESIYDTYYEDHTAGVPNPYKEYASELLPDEVVYMTLPGANRYFVVYEGLEEAFRVHAQAVKEGYTGFTGALITPSLGIGTRIEWQMTKPSKQRKEELAYLFDLVKQRYEQELQHYNIAETERQVELRVTSLEREKQREEEARIQAIRQQALEELQNAYKE